MPIALVTFDKEISRRRKRLRVKGTLSGNYVTGGITVDLTTISNPKLLSSGKAASNPTLGLVLNSPAGYTGELVAGATIKTWLLKVFTTGGAELAAAAFPAALAADPFQFEFEGPLGAF